MAASKQVIRQFPGAPQKTDAVDRPRVFSRDYAKERAMAHFRARNDLPVRQLIAPWRAIGSEYKRAMNNGFACDLWDDTKARDIHTWV